MSALRLSQRQLFICGAAVLLATVFNRGCSPSSPYVAAEKRLIGVWEGALDQQDESFAEKTTKANKGPAENRLAGAELFYVFRPKGRLRFGTRIEGASTTTRARWRIIQHQKNRLTIEVSTTDEKSDLPPVGKIDIEFLDKNRFRLSGVLFQQRTATFHRVKK